MSAGVKWTLLLMLPSATLRMSMPLVVGGPLAAWTRLLRMTLGWLRRRACHCCVCAPGMLVPLSGMRLGSCPRAVRVLARGAGAVALELVACVCTCVCA